MTDRTSDPEAAPQAPEPGALSRELRLALASASGSRRLELLFSQPDPGAVVRALPGDDLYFLIQDVGLSDAPELVQFASPEQFVTLLDLDAWRGTVPDPARMLPWLRAASGSARQGEAGERRWREKLAALDPELVSLLLRSTLRIHDLEEDPDPPIEGDRFLRTPEGRFMVEFLPEGTDYIAIRRLFDELYAQDPFRAGRLLSAVRWELPSDLEESALRWREGRLADLGHPKLEEALSWFARPPRPGKPDGAAGPAARPPGIWLAARGGGTLLDRAAARLSPDELAFFEAEAMAAANAVMVADRVDASDADAVRGAVETARAMLELGLEAAAGTEADAAASLLAATPAKRLFQRGFARLLDLRARVERLWQEGGAGSRGAALLDAPLGEAASALDRVRPLYFPGLETPRADWGPPAAGAFTPRPFRSGEEVRRTASALDDAEGLAALARRIGLAPPAGHEGETTLAALYLTALANERLGRAFAPAPIARSALRDAARALEAALVPGVGPEPRLEAQGQAGELLATLARNRAAELAPLREGEPATPEAVAALLVEP
jgi:hypothetical protein